MYDRAKAHPALHEVLEIMQLPSVDRQPGSAPAGAELALPNAARVLPVAPVNPALSLNPPGVINKIGESATDGKNGLVYRGPTDPAPRSPEKATAPQDWTIVRPEPEKVEVPPPEPISKMLLDFLQAVWRASGNAVEIAQLQNQNNQLATRNPDSKPGLLAKEAVTYSPSKIQKNEKL